MQRWKCAVGAIVLLAVAGGSVTGCGKGGNTKQNAAQAKAKPKADPKTAKADPKAAKADPKAAKAAPKVAAKTDPAAAKTDPKAAANADPKAAKPAQTAANAAKTTAPAQPAPKPSPTPAKPAATTAANPATAKPAAAAPGAATKPAPAQNAAVPTKPAAAPVAKAAPAAVEQTTASSELQANKTLLGQVQSRLPAGTDVVKASTGFRNLTQFVSAVHASHNLSIPFDKMRTAMVDEKKSLSAAIRALKPSASATIEAQRADYDARGMIYQAQHAEPPAAESPAKKAKPATTPGVER